MAKYHTRMHRDAADINRNVSIDSNSHWFSATVHSVGMNARTCSSISSNRLPRVSISFVEMHSCITESTSMGTLSIASGRQSCCMEIPRIYEQYNITDIATF